MPLVLPGEPARLSVLRAKIKAFKTFTHQSRSDGRPSLSDGECSLRLGSCSADVLLTAISSGFICIRGDSLTHALELKDATVILVWMEESDGSGNDTHNSKQRCWQNRLWALWRQNGGSVRAEGGLGEQWWIKSMQSIQRTKARNIYFVGSVMLFCLLRTPAERNNWF